MATGISIRVGLVSDTALMADVNASILVELAFCTSLCFHSNYVLAEKEQLKITQTFH